jgi:hypothetical protein
MATLFNSSLVPDATLAANIQGWATWVEQVITTLGGWTVTSDTGQTAPGSLTGATAQNQKKGYRIYRMNDDFTTDHPIFMRVDFGSGQANFSGPPAGWAPGMWFSFGGGTDGAGNLTGLLWNGVGWNANAATLSTNNHPSQTAPTYPTRNYASGDNSRFIFGMFITDFQNPAGYYGTDQICFSLERSRDRDGNYTGDGLLITYTDSQLYGGGGITAALSAHKYIICDRPGGAQPLLEAGLAYMYVRHSPAYSYDGSVPCALCSHFRGVAQQPGINFILMGINDVSLEGRYQVSMYGQNRVYQNLRNLLAGKAVAGIVGTSSSPSSISDAGCRVSILYD